MIVRCSDKKSGFNNYCKLLTKKVQPGQAATMNISMVAPAKEGTYDSSFDLISLRNQFKLISLNMKIQVTKNNARLHED